MYHIRLSKGMSYSGAVNASRVHPDVYTENEEAYLSAMESGYFTDLTVNGGVPGQESGGTAGESVSEPERGKASGEGAMGPGGENPGRPDEFAEMSVDELKAYAELNGISLAGAKKKAEILGVIREAEAKAAEARGALREQ